MKRKHLLVPLTLTLITFSAPVLAYEVIGKAELEPMAKPTNPSFVAGTKRHWLRDGEESITTIVSLDGDTYSGNRSIDECSWVEMTYEFAAPSLSWKNCNGTSGTQTITKTKGSPWPLHSKSKFEYKFRGSYHDGSKPWVSTRKCKVKAQERVSVPAGEFDTYKLECKDKWNKRTYWFSPDLGHSVLFKRKHNTDASRSYTMEFVKTGNP